MEADPATVLEWLQMDGGEGREVQLMALEQLCNDVLFSDNVDTFFERYQPLTFLPALCRVLLDEEAPEAVLEACARAVTYYLELSNECSRRVVQNHVENMLLSLEMSKELLTKCPEKFTRIPRIQCVIDSTLTSFKSLQAEGQVVGCS